MDSRTMKALLGVFVALCGGVWLLAFALPAGAAPAATTGNDGCGYAASSFTESTVMRWAQVVGSGSAAKIAAYANDEKGLLLGVNGATAMTDPSVSQNGTNGQTGGASYHVSNAKGGSTTATDPSGRFYYPALYITNETANPGNPTAGDFQNGGTPRNVNGGGPFVNDVFGTWSTATVSNSGTNYTVTPPLDKNNWNLGSNSDAPSGTTFSAMGNEGYGAEVRWNVGSLTDSDGNALVPGNTYRIQVIEHDGDQNKSGGDAGEFCVNLTIPGNPGLKVLKEQRIGNTGSFTHDPVFGKIGETVNYRMTVTNTGNVDEAFTFSDPQCDSPPSGPTPALTNGKLPAGQAVVYTCSHVITSADTASGYTNTACATSGALNPCDSVITHVPAIALVKSERIGSNGAFTHGPVTGTVGDTVNYQMLVTNTGDTALTLAFTDAQCDGNTLSGPSPALSNNSLAKGQSVLYTCSHVLAAGDQPYTNTASVVGTAPDGTTVSDHDSVDAFANVPGLTIVKKERIGNSGSFVSGPVFGKIGDTVNYQMTVTNTGNFAEAFTFSDPQCDANTLSGPSPALTNGKLPAGQSVVYTCSHVITASDTASGYTNTACVTSGSLNPCDSVIAHVPGIALVKSERIGSAAFTHGPVTGTVGDTVDYHMLVTNTGDTALTLAFTDAQCDGNTLSGPSPALSNNSLAKGQSVLYTCSHVLTAADQPYTNTASVVGTAPDGSTVSDHDSVKAFANEPGIKVVKLQRDGSSGSFTSNEISVAVGDTINYEIQVTDTGNVPLTLSLDDAHCDANTIAGPTSISGTLNGDVLSPGAVAQYTCSHVATVNDIPQFTNTATVTGRPPSGPPVHGTGIVTANVSQASMQVVKLEKDATAGGGFTRGPITVTEHGSRYVVHTIDYEIQVTNTGSAPLTLSLSDPRCDAGTIQGPAAITGTLSGGRLSPGGQAQYTCSHRYVKGDPTPFTNTATVTGTPPVGPAVHGSSSVTVKRTTVIPKHVCRTPGGRVIHYTGHKKPAACRRKPSRPPKHPQGFTG